jgi:hypothetical protein
MATTRVILHIGMPKTGTSSLQRAFASHAELLRSAGIAYVLIPSDRGLAHHALVDAVLEGDTRYLRRYFEEAHARFEDAEQMLISAEGMSGLRGDDLASWKAWLDRQFGNPEYVIWMMVRRPSSRIPSQWHSYVRRGGRQNLPVYAFEATMRMLQANCLPLQRVFERYESVFGRRCIRVVPMEKLLAARDFVEAAFKAMFGMEGDVLRGIQRRNIALEPGGAELLRVLSLRCREQDPDRVRVFLKPVLRMLRKGDNVFSDVARAFDPFISDILIPDRSEAFLAMEKAARAYLGDQLDGWGDDTIFGPQDPSPARYVCDDHFLENSIRQRLDEAFLMACRLSSRPGRQLESAKSTDLVEA